MTNPQSKHYNSGRKGASHRTNYAGRRKTPTTRTPGKTRQPQDLLDKIPDDVKDKAKELATKENLEKAKDAVTGFFSKKDKDDDDEEKKDED